MLVLQQKGHNFSQTELQLRYLRHNHSGSVMSMAFSRDLARLTSASDDRTVKVWDASSDECLQTLSIGKALDSISFDLTDSYLHTEIGVIDISALSSSFTVPTGSEPYCETASFSVPVGS